MPFSVRSLFVLTVVVLAVGLGVRTAMAASMDFTMATSDAAGMQMPECPECDPDGADAACAFDCAASTVAALGHASDLARRSAGRTTMAGAVGCAGRTGPPEPYPPRPTPT